MSMPYTDLDQTCVNTIRTLAMDAVQQAASGHPGAPMGLAPAAYVLWTRIMKHNPANPRWADRDRFVLSAGHASMLLYSLLHLTGYDLGMADLQHFRQWGSRTPGHPEYGHTPGVETTTGPLGQGVANAVGMAMAERHLAARFNRPDFAVVDHHTYVMCGDGDMMEGVSAEAASLAGHLGLGRLICIYDDNRITIEGSTEIAFTEDAGARYAAYGWHVLRVADGNDLAAIEAALVAARKEERRPSLIVLRTHIAYGSPNKQDTAGAHGAPLGDEEIRLTKRNLGCDEEARFTVPAAARDAYRTCSEAGAAAEARWQKLLEGWAAAYPELGDQWRREQAGDLPDGWDADLDHLFADGAAVATRAASGKVINALAGRVPDLIGGSADLAPSNNTLIAGAGEFQRDAYGGRNLRFGVREHAMAAAASGMALHGGLRPYTGTFFVFSDYMRPAVRLACLMKLPVVYVWTHDSVAVGEDGPTHQPVEHLASLRAMPGLTLIRPADAAETAEAWRVALQHRTGPVALILSRQKLPLIDRGRFAPAAGLARGGYVLADCPGTPDLILIASGSEVALALEAAESLREQGRAVRVVNMASWELFEANPADYREAVLPAAVTRRLAVEMGSPLGWERYVGSGGDVMGIGTFGASAPGGAIVSHYGFTLEHLLQRARRLLDDA